MDDLGAVELPIIEAVVLGPISNLSAPFKFATLNPMVRGTLTEDRLPAVRGVLGEGPELIPVKSIYTFSSGHVLELTHRVAAVGLEPFETADLVAEALFWPLVSRVENEPNHSVRVRTDISFVETDSILARSRLYVEPEGRLWFLADNASADLRRILSQLMTRNDYAVQMREAEIHVDIFSESRFAKIVGVAADTVASAGSTLSVATSLRVGRREDREIEMAFSIPDTLPAGVYQLEVGSAATLGPDSGGGGGGPFGFSDPFGRDETLEDFFVRVNGIDENVILKARLTFVMPFEESASPDSLPDPPPRGPRGIENATAPVSMEKDVDLFLEGSQTLQIRVVGN